MPWKPDRAATGLARTVFEGYEPTVRRNGGHYLVDGTPYGLLELIALGGRYLVATRAPPVGAVTLDAERLPDEVRRHLDRNGLKPWKIVPGDDLAVALEHVEDEQGGEEVPEVPWSHYVRPLAEPPALVGEARRRTAKLMAGLVKAQGPDDPIPALTGPAGVGKRTVAATAAGRLGLHGVELPLGRILIDRVFSTPAETLLGTLLAAAEAVAEGQELLVASGGEWLARLPGGARRQMLAELSRLPNAVLVAGDGAVGRMRGIAAVPCPGLGEAAEVEQLLAAGFPQVRLLGSAREMICRAAAVRGVGILPGRLLYVVRLAVALMEHPEGKAPELSPDEAATAIRIARGAWETDVGPDHGCDA